MQRAIERNLTQPFGISAETVPLETGFNFPINYCALHSRSAKKTNPGAGFLRGGNGRARSCKAGKTIKSNSVQPLFSVCINVNFPGILRRGRLTPLKCWSNNLVELQREISGYRLVFLPTTTAKRPVFPHSKNTVITFYRKTCPRGFTIFFPPLMDGWIQGHFPHRGGSGCRHQSKAENQFSSILAVTE